MLSKTFVEEVEDAPQLTIAFDPSAMNGLYHWQNIFEDLFEPPLSLNDEGQFAPAAAQSWRYSADGMVLTLDLDPSRVWSDGTPVTAKDFVFALNRQRDPNFAHSPARFITSSIAGFDLNSDRPFGVTAPSTFELQIEVTKPFVIDEGMLSESAFAPLPRHMAPLNDPVMWSQWPGGVTNGAYTLEGITKRTIRLLRNPLAPPERSSHFERVETTMRPWSEAVEAFLTGQVDFLYNIPERQTGWFVEEGINTLTVSSKIYYYALNKALPELADRRVRRALRLAVDREGLIKSIFPGGATPAFSLIPKGVQGYEVDPNLIITDTEAAFAEARSLMEAAGYGPDNHLALTISSNAGPEHERIAEFVRFGWSQIYVDVALDLEEKDFVKWFKRFTRGDYVVGRRSWHASKPLMSAHIEVCKPMADPRCGHYDDETFSNTLAAGYATETLAEKRALYQKADRMISEADVLIPLFHGVIPVALSDRIDTSDLQGAIRRIRSFELKLKPPE
ncbi:peptide ABC transporter substrate-binding protein [Palleronia caenipelagi]|uniref:peptide ABC transporter substrate-binding protein n=1 Tax=Palleronia caenipelagi TaxID=2489174 RepID=UPI001C8F6EF2|nr:ABC transporter substrate-binding protein [Palleronia caenipelagi]